MKYFIMVKSHTDYPDLEEEMEAINFEDLKQKFYKSYGFNLQRTDAVCENCFNKTGLISCTH